MDPDELVAWLRLAEAPQVGLAGARRLLAALGSPQAIAQASPAALKEIAGAAAAAAFATLPDGFESLVAATQQWLKPVAGQEPRRVVTLGDASYPQALLQTADPPLLLYVQGRLDLLNAPSLAVVGSRRPSAQGLDNARAFGMALSRAGYTVVSGLALGIDGAAHAGALEGDAGTMAVVGTGLDRVYPKSHFELAHRIARGGALVSEFPIGMPPLAANFPRRNRIIAGMSRGTLVIEAALKSGSLITARLASEAGREVFAVPGSIHSAQSQGCHALIKQGAKLVECAEDVLEELSPCHSSASSLAAAPASDPEPAGEDPLLQALGSDPVSLDALVARTGWPVQLISTMLLEFELDGRVARLPGQLFQRRYSA